MTNIREMIQVLKESNACEESLEWLATLNPESPAQEAWDACPDAGWMIWLADSDYAPTDLYIRARDGSNASDLFLPFGSTPAEYEAFCRARADGVRKAVTFTEVWAAHLESQIRAV